MLQVKLITGCKMSGSFTVPLLIMICFVFFFTVKPAWFINISIISLTARFWRMVPTASSTLSRGWEHTYLASTLRENKSHTFLYTSALLHLDAHRHTLARTHKHNKSCILCRASSYWLSRWRERDSEWEKTRTVKRNEKRREEKKKIERQRERGRQKAAISCSLVLREHIYFPLISNALVNFLSLFIASTCDLSLAAHRKKEKVQNGFFRESITQLLQALCFLSAKSNITLGRCTSRKTGIKHQVIVIQ